MMPGVVYIDEAIKTEMKRLPGIFRIAKRFVNQLISSANSMRWNNLIRRTARGSF